jgi:adenylosuccinate lyase
MKHILADMMVHEDTVRRNVNRAAPLISTEALMFFLGQTIGKQNAHTLVYEVAMQAVAGDRPLLDILMEHPDIAGKFSRKDVEQAILPENHIGMSRQLTDQTVSFVENRLQQRQTPAPDAAACPLCTEQEICLCRM